MAAEQRFSRAKKFLAKAYSYYESNDFESSQKIAKASLQLSIKGYIHERLGRAPRELSQAYQEEEMSDCLAEILSEEEMEQVHALEKGEEVAQDDEEPNPRTTSQVAILLADHILRRLMDRGIAN